MGGGGAKARVREGVGKVRAEVPGERRWGESASVVILSPTIPCASHMNSVRTLCRVLVLLVAG